MKLTASEIADLYVIEPLIFGDHRGYFFESYNEQQFIQNGLKYQFVQDNQSFSRYGTVRGLHYQLPPFAQAKLIRVLRGVILDVVVDLRKDSKSYGKHFSIELSDKNKKQLLIPRGFAHGFSVLSPDAEVFYKCDMFYNPKHEQGIIYNDADLAIDWRLPQTDILISDKDKILPRLRDLSI
jgi:dTDP-4-dehydrorhamnose 3,5-epimerase